MRPREQPQPAPPPDRAALGDVTNTQGGPPVTHPSSNGQDRNQAQKHTESVHSPTQSSVPQSQESSKQSSHQSEWQRGEQEWFERRSRMKRPSPAKSPMRIQAILDATKHKKNQAKLFQRTSENETPLAPTGTTSVMSEGEYYYCFVSSLLGPPPATPLRPRSIEDTRPPTSPMNTEPTENSHPKADAPPRQPAGSNNTRGNDGSSTGNHL